VSRRRRNADDEDDDYDDYGDVDGNGDRDQDGGEVDAL